MARGGERDGGEDGGGYAELVAGVVGGIVPFDRREVGDQRETLAWVASGAPLCRTAKPATPPEHLVAYAVVVDPAARQVLLVDHRLSGLWLPAGGHVEPGERPAVAARRELLEELGVDAPMLDADRGPSFVTRTTTIGEGEHLDVSLWFAFAVAAGSPLAWDRREFRGIRWWPFEAIKPGPGTRFDPELPRFVAKLTARPGPWRRS
jgi:8-oxo-dGTP diphosphatase